MNKPPLVPCVLGVLCVLCGLRATAQNFADMTVVWSPSTSPNIVSNRVYWGRNAPLTNYAEFGDVTNATLHHVPEGVPVMHAIMAIDAQGNQSVLSNTITNTILFAPTNFPVVVELSSPGMRIFYLSPTPYTWPTNPPPMPATTNIILPALTETNVPVNSTNYPSLP